MYWLHFIGQKYYTRTSFVREAKKFGITRRISLNDLAQMAWGDTILLAIKDGKSAVLFGEFTIATLSGLSQEATEALRDSYDLVLTSPGGVRIERGCGAYIAGETYAISASIAEIAAKLKTLKSKGIDIGKPMIGGTFEPHELVRLKDIPHRMGFRKFDYESFLGALETARKSCKRKIPSVPGQFYVFKNQPASGETEGFVQTVRDYTKKESCST